MDILPYLFDIALFAATVFWVGRKPTFPKVTVMTLLIAVVETGLDSVQLWLEGTNMIDWYRQSMQASVDAYSQVLDSSAVSQLSSAADTVVGCLPSIMVMDGFMKVSMALCVVWIVNKLFKRPMDWSPFSKIDLPVWTVVPVIAGALLIAVSNVPGAPYSNIVFLAALNCLVVGVLFFVTQGGAAIKGLMNNVGLPAIAQLAIVAVLVMSGVATLVVPLVGLIDYWANFRKLPREALPE